ncbi:M28 family peptidase [Gemmatimonadota bacterium]
MKSSKTTRSATVTLLLVLFCCPRPVSAQGITTPLEQEILALLTNEISGQMIFNNEVMLAGAPWVREEGELTDTFYESKKIYDLVRSYGIETTRFVRHASEGTFEYPLEGEFWIEEPQKRLVARIGADAALVARGSVTADVTGGLIYIPPLGNEEISAMIAGESGDEYRGKIAIMWSHARGRTAEALNEAGVQAVISFSSRDRYLDPNQVVYSSGSYGMENLRLGFTVSWRQWSELLEDMEANREITVRCMARIEEYPDRFETVYSWIPGTEPDEKGVVFTAHLFEGYTKRGANDNMSGCVIQLEILRALSKLIADGTLPQPRRTIHFIWPNEISGTYEFIKQTPGFAERLSNNINMDMVGEALRMNNSWFTMSECPNYLPNYLDGLATSMMNYVWRTNDIVYLPDAPRGRPGGQYFPVPMMEKNGSLDAFRFFVHQATGGSDHLCFNNASVAVPGIEFFTWPDQWYHADNDTPDKSDPTQMKRVAFIGAATAWAAVNCTDEVVDGLVDVTSSFGYSRIAERELLRALGYVENARAEELDAAMARALNLVDFAVTREVEAIDSIRDMYSGSVEARTAVDQRIRQWELYRSGLVDMVTGFAGVRADQLHVNAPRVARPSRLEQQYSTIIPALHPDVAATEFSLNGFGPYREFLDANPDALREIDFGSDAAARFVLNYVNGERSITLIRDSVAAETGEDISLEAVNSYLELLKEVGWLDW